MDVASYFRAEGKADRVIYEKAFPRFDWGREAESFGQESILKDDNLPETAEEASPERFFEFVEKNISMMELPGRMKGQEQFIELAKEISEECGFSIKILRGARGIRAELSLDFEQYMDGRLNRLIGMADDIMITAGEGKRDVAFELTYNVLGVYNRGRLIFPEILVE